MRCSAVVPVVVVRLLCSLSPIHTLFICRLSLHFTFHDCSFVVVCCVYYVVCLGSSCISRSVGSRAS
ncbi:hypothetical protein F4604DRAFT_1730157 [Suillus subluteus]|nr:hypothetical protein F4604DRAFT_1730157 [Suillus subluteus]